MHVNSSLMYGMSYTFDPTPYIWNASVGHDRSLPLAAIEHRTPWLCAKRVKNNGVEVSLRKANYRHKYVMFRSVSVVFVGGSANGGRIENKMFHC
jgi:hypothetical protein